MNRTSRTSRYGQLLIVLVLMASPVWVGSARRSAAPAQQATNQSRAPLSIAQRRPRLVASLFLARFARPGPLCGPGSSCEIHALSSIAVQGMPNFTGKVTSMDASDVRGVRFRYEAGARSHWHVHDGALVVLVEQGRGRIQLQGQKIQDLVPGQPVLLPGGIPHWHGAAPDQGLTWIAMAVGRDVKWMAPVSDEEYLGKK